MPACSPLSADGQVGPGERFLDYQGGFSMKPVIEIQRVVSNSVPVEPIARTMNTQPEYSTP